MQVGVNGALTGVKNTFCGGMGVECVPDPSDENENIKMVQYILHPDLSIACLLYQKQQILFKELQSSW